MKKFLFLCLFCVWSISAFADMFLIQNVAVDVTDENATIAREKAVAEAQERAFYLLLNRLTLPEHVESLPVLTPEDILNLVQNYSVSNEKTSSVRYIANVNIQFNPEMIQTFFQEYHMPYLTTSAEKHLILPVFMQDKNASPLLWQENNPWLNVWRKSKIDNKIVPIVIPFGDLTDMALLKEEDLTRTDVDTTPLLKRYQVDAVLVLKVVADLELSQIQISVYPLGNQENIFGHFTLTLPLNDSLDNVLDQARQQTMQELEMNWRKENVARFDNPTSLVSVVPLNNLADWVRIREILNQNKLIKNYVVKAVRKDQAQIEIFFAGALGPFFSSLKKDGLFLSPSKGDLWSLRELDTVPLSELESFVLPTSDKGLKLNELPLLEKADTKQQETDSIKIKQDADTPVGSSVDIKQEGIKEYESDSPVHSGTRSTLQSSEEQPETNHLFETTFDDFIPVTEKQTEIFSPETTPAENEIAPSGFDIENTHGTISDFGADNIISQPTIQEEYHE